MEDQFGNIETGYNGSVTIALDDNPGNAVLGGTTTVTASGGVATFSGLTISIVGTVTRSQANGRRPHLAGLDPDRRHADSGRRTEGDQPSRRHRSRSTQTFGLTVTILDQAGVADPDFNGSVTVAIAGPPGSNVLGGTTTVNASGGVANFSGLTLAEVGPVTLQVTSSGLSSVTTSSIDVTAAPASQLVLITNPPQHCDGRHSVRLRGGGGRPVWVTWPRASTAA